MGEAAGRKPILTIAIPTFNRKDALAALLAVLLPQIGTDGRVEVLVSDNASEDGTEAMMDELLAQGAPVRYERQAANVGSDRNFIDCFELARGMYFWLCGDDDIIVPGTVDKVLRHIGHGELVDLIYVTSYAFRNDYAAERQEDRLGRHFHVFTSALEFAKVVNVMFTFISGIIINRERLLEVPHEDPSEWLNTNLIQLSWSLPLLREFRRGVVIWDRALAGQVGNAGGYALGEVFGRELRDTVRRLLPGRVDLQRTILNITVRRWLPQAIYDTRHSRNERLGLGTARADFRRAYGGNLRYWLFAYPVLRLPLRAAKVWLQAGKAMSMAIYVLTVRRFWRKEG